MAFSAGQWRIVGAAAMAALVAACGGGGSSNDIASANGDCSTTAQKTWLRSYMQDRYFWAGTSPNPDPTPEISVADYFRALLLPGEGSTNTMHYWSYISDSAAFNQFFAEGKTLGYGAFVNGVERQAPLKLRFVEDQSPAARAGLKRGDTIVSINGRSAAEMFMSQDFGLNPSKEGDQVSIVIDNGAGPQSYTLSAATYTLTPVSSVKVLDLGGGRKAGYLVLKDFITQAEQPLSAAFASFAQQGATELILDLRYNGGGRISTSNVLASLVAGVSKSGVFAQLKYNSKHPEQNVNFMLGGATGAGFKRVVVLTGSRTCSASELVVNGLKPYVDVVTLGGTTCGKPVGFNPQDNCSSTYSAVNFESLNANNQGRYYDGITATCTVAEDFTRALGDPTEKLTAAAISYEQAGGCPVASVAERARALSLPRRSGSQSTEPGERQGMWAD